MLATKEAEKKAIEEKRRLAEEREYRSLQDSARASGRPPSLIRVCRDRQAALTPNMGNKRTFLW